MYSFYSMHMSVVWYAVDRHGAGEFWKSEF